MFHYILPVDLPMAYQSYLSMVFFLLQPPAPSRKKTWRFPAFIDQAAPPNITVLSASPPLLGVSSRSLMACWAPDAGGWLRRWWKILGKPNKDRNVFLTTILRPEVGFYSLFLGVALVALFFSSLGYIDNLLALQNVGKDFARSLKSHCKR